MMTWAAAAATKTVAAALMRSEDNKQNTFI